MSSNVQNMGADLHLGSPQCFVDVKIVDVHVPLQQLSFPPKYPAPSLEHVLDQSDNKDDIKITPAMYDLPENFSLKEVHTV